MTPYEFHITVKSDNVTQFIRDCKEMGCKPVVLELQAANREIQDLQTTDRYELENDEAARKMCDTIKSELEIRGYPVVRAKIESVPWHYNAPAGDEPMPKGCYFESHLRVTSSDAQQAELKELARMHRAHLSRNIFKRIDDTHYKMMVTLRNPKDSVGEFINEVQYLQYKLKCSKFEVDKVEVEFVLYDSNQQHDNEWLGIIS